MYKEYLIVAMNKDHSDTKVYWDSSVGEVRTDISLLRKTGYEDLEIYHLKIDQIYDFNDNKFITI